MASYKLIQDIEADDKLLGPLSFRQFLYSLIAVFFLYVSYLLYIHHAGFLDIATIPIVLFAGFLAYPFGKDQPTEVWAIAKLRFLIKPRRRIWAQSGIKEQVTITVPKRVDVQLTNDLSQTEVKSRLQALANTIDSRGWAIKNVGNVYQSPLAAASDSDRLISAPAATANVPDDVIPDVEDPYNETNGPVAKQVNQLLSDSTSHHRQELIDHLNAIRTDLSNPQQGPTNTTVSQPNETAIKEELKTAHATSQATLNNMHTLRDRISQPTPTPIKSAAPKAASRTDHDPDIMNLSHRDDLNVNVISHEIDRAREVQVSLH